MGFFQILLKQYDNKKLAGAIEKLLKKPSLPRGVNEELVDKLPSSPGVYVFYDLEGTPLYVGKSVNIRDRVMSHFYSDYKSTKEFQIAQQVSNIEYLATEGELEALLKEKQTVTKLQPLYNRRLRDSRSLLVALRRKTKKGYATLVIKDSNQVGISEIVDILAVFKSGGQAKRILRELAREHKLCQKLLGLEKGKGKCFGSQIEQCLGACEEKEDALFYNLRFDEAFSRTKVRQWPFPGAIIIPEGKSGHAVDNWCYLGLINESEKLSPEFFAEPQFDYDTYKILANYLLNPKNTPKVKLIA